MDSHETVSGEAGAVHGFDEKVLWLYGSGATTREIQAHLQELYDVEVSPALISRVTDAVLDEVKAWQNRPLDAVYPIVYLDALHVKIRTEGRVAVRAIYLALAVDLTGQKELLGLWIGEAEGAKFWLNILTDLNGRGVKDILICAVCVFRPKSATDSDANRPLIPIEFGHPFRRKSATYSDAKRPPRSR